MLGVGREGLLRAKELLDLPAFEKKNKHARLPCEKCCRHIDCSLLYVNEPLSVPRHHQAIWYVDDAKIFLGLPPSQISDAVAPLNKDLSAIARWCCMNSLLINPGKTKLLVIGVPQLIRTPPSIPPVKLLGKEIKPVTVAKGLGVLIDSSLSYNEHVTKTVSNCMYRLIRINRIKHLLDRKTLLLLINAFVFS